MFGIIFFVTCNLTITFLVWHYHTHRTHISRTRERFKYVHSNYTFKCFLNHSHCAKWPGPQHFQIVVSIIPQNFPHYHVFFIITCSIFYTIALNALICTWLMSVLNKFLQMIDFECFFNNTHHTYMYPTHEHFKYVHSNDGFEIFFNHIHCTL